MSIVLWLYLNGFWIEMNSYQTKEECQMAAGELHLALQDKAAIVMAACVGPSQ